MTKKFHVTDDGPKVCVAKNSSSCTVGGFHSTDFNAVVEMYENKMKSDTFTSFTLSKLNDLAKTSNDDKVFEAVIKNGSNRTKKNLSLNPHVSSDVLARVYETTDDLKTRVYIASHKNFDVENVTPEDIPNIVVKDGNIVNERFLKSSRLNTAAFKEIDKNLSNFSALLINNGIGNPDNNIDTESRFRIAADKNISLNYLGRIPVSKEIVASHITKKNVELTTLNQLNNEGIVSGVSEWVAANPSSYSAKEMAVQIANLPDAKNDDLVNAAHANMESVLSRKGVSDNVKSRISERYPEKYKAFSEDLKRKAEKKAMRDSIVVEEIVNSPHGINRGYKEHVFKIDPDVVKKLGLSNDDLQSLFNDGSFNGGIFVKDGQVKGVVDSTD